ncbi:MAG: hypothetical protein AB4040_08920 [Synechococcus sp.]
MNHSFLIEPGRWLLKGHLIVEGESPLSFSGQGLVKWDNSRWFHAILRMVFSTEETDRAPLLLEYRGCVVEGASDYSFVLQHGDLGRVEGKGWMTPATLVHRYWVLGDSQKRQGYESFFRADKNRYCLSSGVMSGLKLVSTLEAMLERV